MLSSTLVSVLAPQWSGRQRRNKRGMASMDIGVVGTATGEAGQETQGNGEDGTVLLNLRYPYRQTTQNQRVGERGLILGPQAHKRVCGRLFNRAVTPTSPNSPQLHAPGVKSQAGRQGDQLFLHGDTSGLDVSPTVTNDRSSDRIRAQLSFTNDGDRETSKSFPYCASPAYRPTSNDSEAASRGTRPFSTSPSYLDSEGQSVTNRPQTFRAHPHLTIPSKQTLLFSSVERLSPSDRPDGTTVPVGESHLLSSPPSLYDRLDFLRSQSLPRGTALRSTSWRKLSVLGDGGSNSSSPLSPTTANNNNNVSSLSHMSSNDNTGPSGTNNNRIDHQSAISNKNYFCANLNSHAVTRKHTNVATLVKSDAQDEPDHDSDRSPRMQDAFNSNDRQPHFSSNINSPTRSNTVGSPINTSRPESYRRLSSSYTTSAPLTVFSPNSPKTPDGLETGDRSSSLSNTSSSNQHFKRTPMSPMPSVGKTRTPVGVQRERSAISPKSHCENNTPTSFGCAHDSSSGQPSVQTSGASICLSSHRPLYRSHSVDITRDPHNTPKYPLQIIKNQDPIVSSTHAPTSLLQSPKTDHTPTSVTAVQSLTRYLTPTPYSRRPPPGERTLTGSLATSSAQGRSTAQRPGRDSLESGHSGEMGGGLPPSHSLQSPADLMSPLSPTRPRRSVEGPAIFSSLRSGSSTSPLSPPTPRTTRLHVWRGESVHHLSRMSDTVGDEEGPVLSRGGSHGSRFTFDGVGTDSAALGPQRKTAAPLSLPDFGSYYKPRFSSPPYASLKSSRPRTTSTQGPLSPPTSPQHYPSYNRHRTRSQDGSNVFALEISSGKNYSEPTSEDNVEVLVYRISKVDSSAVLDSIRPAQHYWPGHTEDTQVVSEIKCNVLPCAPSGPSPSSQHCQAIGSPSCPSYQSSNGGGAVATEIDVCKTESFPTSAVAPLQTQSPKKGFFSLRNKRDSVVGGAAASVPRTSAAPPSEEPKPEGQKATNKMDQMLCRLRRTFRVKRFDDDRRKRTTPALCDNEPSDVSYVTEGSDSRKQPDEESKEVRRKDESVLKPPNSVWIGNKHTSDTTKDKVHHQHSQLKGFKDNDETKNRGQSLVMDLPQIESHEDQNITEPSNQLSPSEISPTRRQFEAYKEERIRRARNLSPQSGVSPTRCQNWDPSRCATLPGYRPSSASSVFHFSQEYSDNDNVFLSPKLLQRKKTTSLCEPRNRGSGSCADLKYGLEAGRSFSVSYVMSNRRSDPGRISTGPRVVSCSDLTDPALTFKGEDMTGDDLWAKGDRKILSSDSTADHKTTGDSPRTGSKSRNVSWSSEVIGCSPTTICGRMLNPSSPVTSHFMWDTEGPPTPPPSPPWSPVSRRTYRSLSSSSSSLSPSDRRASPDSLSPRGHLPSRGYISSLAAFKELDVGSDRDSDSTTDDEYYLSGDGGNKETEL